VAARRARAARTDGYGGDAAGTPADSDGEHDVDEEAPAPRSLTFWQHVSAFVKELIMVIVGAVIVASLVRAFLGQMFIIPSVSMEKTLKVGDRVAVEKLSSVKRGEVVVFTDPGGWLTEPQGTERGPIGQALEFIGILPDVSANHLIKRVIGLPGDHVVCCDPAGRMSVNDQPLDESSYLYTAPDGTRTAPSEIRFDVTVPDHRIFVLGDNRSQSRDSRCHLNDMQAGTLKGENAFVSEDLVVGRAIAVVWPLGDASWLTIDSTFDAVPSGAVPAPGQAEIHAGAEANC
jgi:signal peptidase I